MVVVVYFFEINRYVSSNFFEISRLFAKLW